jgi:hypothetical protein
LLVGPRAIVKYISQVFDEFTHFLKQGIIYNQALRT